MQERVHYPDPEDLKHSMLLVLNLYLKVILHFSLFIKTQPNKTKMRVNILQSRGQRTTPQVKL